MPADSRGRESLIRGKLYKFLNVGLCFAGIIFVLIGVFRSTLLLYIGCALIGAAVGGFIRSRLPINAMVPSTGVHLVYRSDGRRNMQQYNNGLQTYVIMHSQQPCGIGQKKINQCTSITKFFSSNIFATGDSFDRVSVVSAITEKAESNDNCCIVCLIQFKNGQEVRQLPCLHIFHINCIDRWLKINRLCPTCRMDVTLPSKAKDPLTTSGHLPNNRCHEFEITVQAGCSDVNCGDTQVPTVPADASDPIEVTDIREDLVGTSHDVTDPLASRNVIIEVTDDVTGLSCN